jgi:DNA (cytosine-5)-methyltransferase 1
MGVEVSAYYNEFDPKKAHMLLHLIKDGHIAPGDVDNRPIQEVKADDLRGYTQCHFFAGIGGWSVALRLAGWPDDKFAWTGSCPCQPFSTAGRQKGKADERHLWPMWFRLIRESRPSIVFGEQVSAAIRHGWWDDVADDLEGEGYATRAEIRPASSVGKPHKRDRLWFVGNAKHHGYPSATQSGSEGQAIQHNAQGADSTSEFAGAGSSSNVADTISGGRQGQRAMGESLHTAQNNEWQAGESLDDSASIEWLQCPDGKSRPVKSGVRLLVDGLQHRAPILHALGDAIVPDVAAAFIKDCGA